MHETLAVHSAYNFHSMFILGSKVAQFLVSFQIAKRRREHQEQNPDAKIISLGIGDTTEPIPQYIADAMSAAAAGMATREGYSG